MPPGGKDRAELLREALTALDEIVAAESVLTEELALYRTTIERAHEFFLSGKSVQEFRELVNVTEQRATVDDAMRNLEIARLHGQHAMYRLASADGMTAAEIGRLWGVSRQLISRVLNADPEAS